MNKPEQRPPCGSRPLVIERREAPRPRLKRRWWAAFVLAALLAVALTKDAWCLSRAGNVYSLLNEGSGCNHRIINTLTLIIGWVD